MQKRKGFLGAAVLFFCLCFLSSCGQAERYTAKVSSVRPLMETASVSWESRMAENCGVPGLGRPYGTEKTVCKKEETKDGRKVWITDFTLKETATEELIAGYAKSVWEACIEADGNQMHRDNRAYYDDLAEARRRQEPFDYYLWYYFAADREFRLSITASEMERNAPGGLVLRIEEWK